MPVLMLSMRGRALCVAVRCCFGADDFLRPSNAIEIAQICSPVTARTERKPSRVRPRRRGS